MPAKAQPLTEKTLNSCCSMTAAVLHRTCIHNNPTTLDKQKPDHIHFAEQFAKTSYAAELSQTCNRWPPGKSGNEGSPISPRLSIPL